VDVNAADTYGVKGIAADGTEITATVKVMNINYVKNPGFDEADMSMWKVEDNGSGNSTDVQKKAADALSGENAFHFYSTEVIDFKLEQELSLPAGGEYAAVVNIQGGDVGSDAQICLYVECGNKLYSSGPVKLSGWQQWQKAKIDNIAVSEGETVKIGVTVKAAAKGWGTIDDFEFYSLK
jgi:arabinogalactan endo-1,4-beta-galactosidase